MAVEEITLSQGSQWRIGEVRVGIVRVGVYESPTPRSSCSATARKSVMPS